MTNAEKLALMKTWQAEMQASDALLAPPGPPERIHGWQHTQMSIARYYGGINYNGHGYTVAINEPGQPLVRDDVLVREAKTAKEAAKAERRLQRNSAKAAQGDLL